MTEITSRLVYTGKRGASIYFDAYTAGDIRIDFSNKVETELISMDGEHPAYRLIPDNNPESESFTLSARITEPGIYRLSLISGSPEHSEITVSTDDGITPFLLPGLGIVPSHGDETALLLAKNHAHELWTLADGGCDGYFVPIIRGIPEGELASFTVSTGGCAQKLPTDWYPKLGRSFSWHSTELFTDAQCIKCELSPSPNDIRYTVFGGTVTTLREPKNPLMLCDVTLKASSDGKPIDARFSFFIGEERVAMFDVMRDEKATVKLPVGAYRVEISHGFRYETRKTELVLLPGKPESIREDLAELFALPEGWALGELHIHSAFEDATAFPTQVMRAARAYGINFCFQTDKDIPELLAYPLEKTNVTAASVADSFLSLRGQEIMCQELHMNVLNTDRHFPNPEADNLSRLNPDIEAKIAAWVAKFNEMKAERPCLLMHNHPSHRPEVQKYSGYFRSWWVSDKFDGFSLVENFDTRTWYDRLTRGRVQYGAWTSDCHDCTLIPPGEECVCVYVGKRLDEASLIDALEHGRFYAMRTPGMFMDLRAQSGEMSGETVLRKPGEQAKLLLHIDSHCPISAIEWVVNGRSARVDRFDELDGIISHDGELTLPDDAVWCHVKVALHEHTPIRDKHTTTPLYVEGFAAYSNPIFIRDAEV